MNKSLISFIILVVVGVVGAYLWQQATHPSRVPPIETDAITFYALEPDPTIREVDPPRERYFGVPVIGNIELADATQREDAMRTLTATIVDYNAVGCIFEPRHAFHVEYGGETVDYLLCFKCGQLETFQNGERIPGSIRPDEKGFFDTLHEKAVAGKPPRQQMSIEELLGKQS